MAEKFKRWLFLSGPIGRALQWAARPGREIAEAEFQAETDLIFGPSLMGDKSFPENSVSLEPCINASAIGRDAETGAYFKD